MNKEEYIAKMADLEHTKEKALEYNRKESKKATKKYVDDNCPLKVGQTISLCGVKGVIETLDANQYDGTFYGTWRKFKKNGEPYSYTCRFSRFDIDSIEKVN